MKRDTTYNRINGEFLGYPECCINAFGDVAMPFFKRPHLTQKASLNGFLPCERCAIKLLKAETTYDQLINKKRKCTIPFKAEHTALEDKQIHKELDQLKEYA